MTCKVGGQALTWNPGDGPGKQSKCGGVFVKCCWPDLGSMLTLFMAISGGAVAFMLFLCKRSYCGMLADEPRFNLCGRVWQNVKECCSVFRVFRHRLERCRCSFEHIERDYWLFDGGVCAFESSVSTQYIGACACRNTMKHMNLLLQKSYQGVVAFCTLSKTSLSLCRFLEKTVRRVVLRVGSV